MIALLRPGFGDDVRPQDSRLNQQAAMSVNALYTDPSDYYDLMCADIDYQAQSHCIHRLQQLFGNGGTRHLNLACGTGPMCAISAMPATAVPGWILISQ